MGNTNVVLFYGAGKKGKKLIKRFQEFQFPNYHLAGYMDKNKTGEYCGYPVIPMEAVDSDVNIVITVESPGTTVEIYKELKKRGFANLFWHVRENAEAGYGTDFLKSDCISCKDWGTELLPQAEMHVADFCNLNCKGCTHFSPVFTKGYPDISKRMQDVIKLKGKFSHILRFFLLGGEPFLNNEISEYVRRLRGILPDTDLVIVTNGLLVPSLPGEVLETIKEHNIQISISEYEPTHKIIKAIVNRLENYKISYGIRPYDRKRKFNKPLSLSVNSIYSHNCISDGCITIWEGKISRCPTLMYIDVFNQKFGTSLPNTGIIQLDDARGGVELLAEMEKEVPLCKHCVENEIEWECCSKEVRLEDFAVHN